MMMNRLAPAVGATARLALLLLLAIPSGQALAQGGGNPVRALVLTNLGEHTGIVTVMEARGWIVTAAEVEGWTVTAGAVVELDSNDLGSQFDVVWIPAETNPDALHRLMNGGLVVFTLEEGGVVVVTGVGGTALDIAPGGPDAEPLSAGAGAVTIAAVDHASITGVGIGGSALTAADLDPTGGGGRGSLRNAPEGATVIAQNSDGPVVVDYAHGDGHVLVSALLDPSDACTQNVVLYVETLVR